MDTETDVVIDYNYPTIERDTEQFIANRTSDETLFSNLFEKFCEPDGGGKEDFDRFLRFLEECDWELSYGIYGDSDLDYAWYNTTDSFLTHDLYFMVFYTHGGCLVALDRGGYNSKVEIRACENDEAMADFSSIDVHWESAGESAWCTLYSFSGADDNDGSGLGTAIDNALDLEPEDELPVDEDCAYWVSGHDTLDDGLYWKGTACTFG